MRTARNLHRDDCTIPYILHLNCAKMSAQLTFKAMLMKAQAMLLDCANHSLYMLSLYAKISLCSYSLQINWAYTGPSQYVYKIITLLCIFYIYYMAKKYNRMTSGWHKRKKGISLYCHDLEVTIDGVQIGEWIYWLLLRTTWNYK
jgi:hypothetical protein